MRITATSITSCTIAAGTGTSHPAVAASMASADRLMPTMMLCTAMRRARCAITIASPTRSRRSARITTSAASDEARGAARAQRDAHVGRRQRRGVVDAVADHDGRIEPLLGTHRVDLVGGNAIGQHGIEIERGADRLRGGGAVAGDHDDAGNAGLAQHADGMRRVGAQLVGEQQRADRPPLDGDEHDQRRPPRGAPYRPPGPFAGALAAKIMSREPALTGFPAMMPCRPEPMAS